MKNLLGGEVKWGPTSALLALGAVVFAAVFVWQLVESGDPAEAGTRTAAIFTAFFAAAFGVVRAAQAIWGKEPPDAS